MAARTTMADLITFVRELVDDTGSADWTDVQIEQRLDLTRVRVRRVLLDKDVTEERYKAPDTFLEGHASTWTGEPIIAIWDSPAASATEITPATASGDSWNLMDGEILFGSDQDDSYWMDYYCYDPYLAASHLLTTHAAKKTITDGLAESGGVGRSRSALLALAHSYRQMAKHRKAEVKRLYHNRFNLGGRM